MKETIICNFLKMQDNAFLCFQDNIGDIREIDILVYIIPVFLALISLFFVVQKYII